MEKWFPENYQMMCCLSSSQESQSSSDGYPSDTRSSTRVWRPTHVCRNSVCSHSLCLYILIRWQTVAKSPCVVPQITSTWTWMASSTHAPTVMAVASCGLPRTKCFLLSGILWTTLWLSLSRRSCFSSPSMVSIPHTLPCEEVAPELRSCPRATACVCSIRSDHDITPMYNSCLLPLMPTVTTSRAPCQSLLTLCVANFASMSRFATSRLHGWWSKKTTNAHCRTLSSLARNPSRVWWAHPLSFREIMHNVGNRMQFAYPHVNECLLSCMHTNMHIYM